MLDFIKKYQSSIGYSLLLIVAIAIFVFRIVYRYVGFNTLYDEAFFLFRLQEASLGIIDGSTIWNFIAIHLFPYLNLYNKVDAYLANILLHIASVVIITIATCYKKNVETWLKYSALYSAVYTLSMYYNQELTYVSFMVFFMTIIISLCMILRKCKTKIWIALCCAGIGFVVPWAVLCTLPSGALTLLCIFILLLSYYWGEWDKFGISVASGIGGIIFGLLYIHCFVINLFDMLAAMRQVADTITTTKRGYDPLSFFKQVLVVGKNWLLTLGGCAIVYSVTSLTSKSNRKWLTILGESVYVIAMLLFYNYHSHIKTTEALLFSTITIFPLLLNIRTLRTAYDQYKWVDVVIWIFLLAFPLIASIGTNIYLGKRMGCFMFSYVFLLSILPKNLVKINAGLLIAACFVVLAPSCKMMYETLSHKDAMVYYENNNSPISNILLEPSQADYFAHVDSILNAHQFDRESDFAFAVNEDFATLYALEIKHQVRPYVVSEIVYTTMFDSIVPQCIFIAQWEVDEVMELTNNKWSIWGFPDAYESIEVGSPDAYRGKNTDRLLYIRK